MLKVLSLQDARALVVRALIVSILATLVGMGNVHRAHASDPTATPPCYDIVGQGQPVAVSGVNNSGIVSFDPISGNPLYQYEACAVDPDGDPTVGNFELRGWSWDDNLGWISFYCPSGAGATNLGIACSNASYTGGYGVQVNPVTGKFSGYAWGDNVGWISFDNPGFSTVSVDATTPGCQGYVYSTTLPDPSCPNTHSKSNTAAWSDNVGWIDFDGILLPWYSLIAEITDAGVTVTLETPSGVDPSEADLTNAPVANGNDYYRLRVHIQDKKGNNIDNGGRYTVTVTPEWALDTVKKDQTHTGAPLGAACPGGGAQNAVYKPCLASDIVNTGSGNYDFDIKALAPTSNMNGWDKNGDGTVDFRYESFVIPTALSAPPVQANILQLQDVKIQIIDNDAGGACVYGTGATCDGKVRTPAYNGLGDTLLKFSPQTNVTSLKSPADADHPAGNDDYIQISTGSPVSFPVAITGSQTVTFYAGIDPSTSPDFGFQFDTDADGILAFPPGDGVSVTANSATTSLSAGVGVKPETPVPAYVPGLYMYSEVSGSGGIKYYSNKLPKTLGSISVLPVAVLKGNVYSSGATGVTVGQAVRSLGDVSTNILRDTIFRNVQKIIAGVKAPTDNNSIEIIPNATDTGFDIRGTSGNLAKLLPDSDGNAKVYYHRGDLTLNSLVTDFTWKGERTIVVVGGNVYIKANIYNDPATYTSSNRPKLGIIVLKDLTDTSANRDKQGHVYIDPNVTNIQANIFADGSAFSFVDAVTTPLNAKGEPVYASVTDQELRLKYTQLFIEGSLASQNTVGGSSLAEPVIGTGEVATASDKLLQSRTYDLNYLRYYTGFLKRDASGVPVRGDGYVPSAESEITLTDTNGAPLTAYAGTPPGYLYSPVFEGLVGYKNAVGLDSKFDLGATYISFDPPTPTLPGFGTESAGTQNQLPQ